MLKAAVSAASTVKVFLTCISLYNPYIAFRHISVICSCILSCSSVHAPRYFITLVLYGKYVSSFMYVCKYKN